MENVKRQECDSICDKCSRTESRQNDVHLHQEIQNLRQCIAEKDYHIMTMETQFLHEAQKHPNGEVASLKEDLHMWQDKYTRLNEAYIRVQKVNQNLEDKLLKIVDKCETEKDAFTKDVATLTHRLNEAKETIHRLFQDNEKYRADVNFAIGLLKCNTSNYAGQKYESLPPAVQAKVRSYNPPSILGDTGSRESVRRITVPISTFPPTAMVYNIAKPPSVEKQDDYIVEEPKPVIDEVPIPILAVYLEDREKERRHCITCKCQKSVLLADAETQTQSEYLESSSFAGKDTPSSNNKLSRAEMKKMTAFRDATSELDTELNGKRPLNNQTSDGRSTPSNFDNAKNTVLSLKSSTSQQQQQHQRNGSMEKTHRQKKSLREDAVSNEKKVPNKGMVLDDKAKIELINDRLWKSSWQQQQLKYQAKESNNETRFEVINERDWRNSRSVNNVSASDDTASLSATSPCLSGDSGILDPSSLSSSEQQLQQQQSFKQPQPLVKKDSMLELHQASSGWSPSGAGKPSTVQVHLAKAQNNVAAVVAGSKPTSIVEDSSQHLQRVTQWLNESTQQRDCPAVVVPVLNLNDAAATNGPKVNNNKSCLNERGVKQLDDFYPKLSAGLPSVMSNNDAATVDATPELLTIEQHRQMQKRRV
ncbi:hypothetical protein TKK_0002668 [Trichogramma kaykai]